METLFKLAFSGKILFLFEFSCCILIIDMHYLPIHCIFNDFSGGLGSKSLWIDPVLGTIDQPATGLPKVLSLYSAKTFAVVDCLELGLVLS